MILRMWTAKASKSKAGDYIAHAQGKVFPTVRCIQGNCGAYLLSREAKNGVELMVLTLWESIEAIRKFAGPDPEKAVVEPEARAVLTSFDERVTHYEVVDRV